MFKLLRFPMFTALILPLVPMASFADVDSDLAQSVTQNIYNIQSTCASSGQYTALALSHTRKIKSHLESLKNNPKCKGLPESVDNAITKIGENLQNIDQSQKAIGDQSSGSSIGFTSLGKQMIALRSFAQNVPVLRGAVVAGLMKSVLQSQRLQSVAKGINDIENDPTKKLSQAQAQQILDAKATMSRAANQGLYLVNSTLDSFGSHYQDCLDDSATTAAYLASGMTQMLASFVSTSESSLSGTTAAHSVNKIVNFLGRNKKYMTALRKLNETEFHTTLSCLIEMTTEGYCAVEDAQVLLNEVKKDFKLVEKTSEPTTAMKEAGAKSITYIEAEAKNFQSLLQNGPMAGQYILSNQLPLVTEWVNKLQFGVEPQLPTEAQFQVQTFQTGLEPFVRMKQVLGNYNVKLAQLPGITSIQSKQNLVLEMLVMMSDAFTRVNGDSDNFFLRVHQVRRMPFALLGIPYNDMPKEVFIPTNNQLLDPIEYLQTNFQKMPQFANPDALAYEIKRNAEDVFNKADGLAQQFFLQFFIPDEIAVVTESMVGMNKGDVRSALRHIDLYLKDFIQRIGDKDSGDAPFVVMALDMRKRIGHIFARYKQMHDYGLVLVEQIRAGKIEEKDLQEKMIPMARDFIQDVYDQFFVKKMRAAWLSYRLNLLVRKDYSLALQQRSFTDKALQDLLLATGLESLNQLFGQSGVNLSTAEIDLAQARSIYWSNITALEEMSRAPMQNYINQSRLIADPKIISNYDMWYEANKYTYGRYAEKTPTDNPKYGWLRSLKGGVNNLVEGLFAGFGVLNPNVKYGWPEGAQQVFNTKRPDLTDGSNNDAQKIWAKNCALMLAFYDLSPYWYLCKNSTYFSSFYDESKYKGNKPVSEFLRNELSTDFTKKAWAGIKDPKKPSKAELNENRKVRICALRDHYRKNYVVQVTAGLQRNNVVYDNEFTKLIERPVIDVEPPPPPPKPPVDPVVPEPPVDEIAGFKDPRKK